MNPTMTPAAPSFALPTPTLSPPTFEERLRPRKAGLFIGLGLGLALELFVDGVPFGVGHALFAVLIGVAIATHGGKEGWQRAGEHRWMLFAGVLLWASVMLHASTWLAVMAIASSWILIALALQGWTGERPLSGLRTGQLLGAPFKTLGQSVYAGAVTTSRGLEDAKVSSVVSRYGPSALRLVAIIVPPVLVLLVLLTSGDAVFRARVESVESALFGIPLSGFVRGAFVTVFSGVILAGAMTFSNRRRDGAVPSAPSRVLRGFESLALLGTLTTLLFCFGVASTPCALAPASCELPAGVTYSDAAHEGFFQLLIAASGILMLLMALPARTKLESKGTALGFTALSTALVLATMPMVVSAIARLWRYETTYGLTVLRLMAYAGLGLVAAVLAWRAVTLWAFKSTFVHGAIGLFTLTLFSLAVMRPDAVIARHNLQMENVDYAYLATLSADVVPPMVAAGALRELGGLQDQKPDPAFGWNLGRAAARSALMHLDEL
ncbi:MAG: DUF4173 domain-containing protein [Myxococcaceae bacterium]